jgi:hypothetical protein
LLPWSLVFWVGNGRGSPFTIFLIIPVLRLLSIRVRNFLGNVIIALKVMGKGNELCCRGKII